MAAFRESVAASFLFKFFIASCLDLQQQLLRAPDESMPGAPVVPDSLRSVALVEPRAVSSGVQMFDLPLPSMLAAGLLPRHESSALAECGHVDLSSTEAGLPPSDASLTGPDAGGSVGKPVMHASALYQVWACCINVVAGFPIYFHCCTQVTGEALYCDDISVPSDCLEAALVLSNRAYARITSIDVAPAMAIAGVVDVVLAKDIPGKYRAACLDCSVALAY